MRKSSTGQKDVYEYYYLIRKVIRSKTLTEKEASQAAILFTEARLARVPKKSILTDILYDRLLKLISFLSINT